MDSFSRRVVTQIVGALSRSLKLSENIFFDDLKPQKKGSVLPKARDTESTGHTRFKLSPRKRTDKNRYLLPSTKLQKEEEGTACTE